MKSPREKGRFSLSYILLGNELFPIFFRHQEFLCFRKESSGVTGELVSSESSEDDSKALIVAGGMSLVSTESGPVTPESHPTTPSSPLDVVDTHEETSVVSQVREFIWLCLYCMN